MQLTDTTAGAVCKMAKNADFKRRLKWGVFKPINH